MSQVNPDEVLAGMNAPQGFARKNVSSLAQANRIIPELQSRIIELEAEVGMLHRSLASRPDTATSSGAAQAMMGYQIEIRDKRNAALQAGWDKEITNSAFLEVKNEELQDDVDRLTAKLKQRDFQDEVLEETGRLLDKSRAEVKRYRDAIQATIDDLLIRGEVDSQGCRVVNLSASTWEKLNDSLEQTEKDDE
jgi:hypothetical protein